MPKQPLDLNLGQTEGSAAVRNVLMAIPEFSLVWQELTSLNLTTSQLTPVMPFLHQEERKISGHFLASPHFPDFYPLDFRGTQKPLPQTFLCFLTAAQLHWPALPPYVDWLVGFHLLLELVLLV